MAHARLEQGDARRPELELTDSQAGDSDDTKIIKDAWRIRAPSSSCTAAEKVRASPSADRSVFDESFLLGWLVEPTADTTDSEGQHAGPQLDYAALTGLRICSSAALLHDAGTADLSLASRRC